MVEQWRSLFVAGLPEDAGGSGADPLLVFDRSGAFLHRFFVRCHNCSNLDAIKFFSSEVNLIPSSSREWANVTKETNYATRILKKN